MRSAPARIAGGWNDFWFRPQATSTLALVRIAGGLLALGWGLSLLPDLFAFFSDDGLLPAQPENQGDGVWGLLGMFESDAAVVGLAALLIVASIALTVGLFTRFAAFAVLVCLIAFARRNSFVLNSGDGLLRVLILFLAFSPAGESLSLDRLRKARERFWEFPDRAPWGLRLLQVQLSVLYVSTVWQKVRGANWNDGTAVSFANRIDDLERFPLPSLLKDDLLMSNLLTFGTLAVELSLGILIWNRMLRPWVIGFGVALHLGIDYSLRVGFFSYAILACYLAFIPPETASRLIERVRAAVAGFRGRTAPAPAGVSGTAAGPR